MIDSQQLADSPAVRQLRDFHLRRWLKAQRRRSGPAENIRDWWSTALERTAETTAGSTMALEPLWQAIETDHRTALARQCDQIDPRRRDPIHWMFIAFREEMPHTWGTLAELVGQPYPNEPPLDDHPASGDQESHPSQDTAPEPPPPPPLPGFQGRWVDTGASGE